MSSARTARSRAATSSSGRCIDGLRVVREGVAADDWVITRGLQRARPGTEVTPKREALDRVGAPPQAGAKAQE